MDFRQAAQTIVDITLPAADKPISKVREISYFLEKARLHHHKALTFATAAHKSDAHSALDRATLPPTISIRAG